MTFSVVIPLYNKENYILRAMQSVLNQSYRHFELIVVDDGSTDGGPALAARLGDPRIRVIRQRNGGVSAARNRGIAEATMPYIAFLDADDAWEPEHLQYMAQLIDDYPYAGFYCSGYRTIEPSGKVRGPEWFHVPTRGCVERYFLSVAKGDLVATASSVCIPRKVLDLVGGFPVGEPLGEDQDMWARIALSYPLAVDSRATTTYYRNAKNRGCVTIPVDKELPYLVRLQRLLDTNALPPDVAADLQAYIRHGLIAIVSVNLRNGQPRAARMLLRDPRLQARDPRLLAWSLLARMSSGISKSSIKAVDLGRGLMRSLKRGSPHHGA